MDRSRAGLSTRYVFPGLDVAGFKKLGHPACFFVGFIRQLLFKIFQFLHACRKLLLRYCHALNAFGAAVFFRGQLEPLTSEHLLAQPWGQMAVVPLDHLDRRAHLHRQRVHIHAIIQQRKRRIGVA